MVNIALMVAILFLGLLFFENITLRGRLLLYKMHYDLEEWIGYGVGDDIKLAHHRPEFQSYVERAMKNEIGRLNVPNFVVRLIREDLKSKAFNPIFIKLVFIELKKKLL